MKCPATTPRANRLATVATILLAGATPALRAEGELELTKGHTLVPRASFTDTLGQKYIRARHFYMGIPVWGSEATIRMDDEGRPLRDATAAPDLDLAETTRSGAPILRPLPIRLDLKPRMSVDHARKAVRHSLDGDGQGVVFHGAELVIFPVFRTVVLDRPAGRPLNAMDAVRVLEGHRLAWHLIVDRAGQGRWDWLVDAHTGEVLLCAPADSALWTPGTLKTWRYGEQPWKIPYDRHGFRLADLSRGTVDMENAIFDGDPPGMVMSRRNPKAWGSGRLFREGTAFQVDSATFGAEALYSLGAAWDYFLHIHKRNGWDGKGAGTLVRMNSSRGPDSIFWLRDKACISIGPPGRFVPPTSVQDIGHELAHGVASATARFQREPAPLAGQAEISRPSSQSPPRRSGGSGMAESTGGPQVGATGGSDAPLGQEPGGDAPRAPAFTPGRGEGEPACLDEASADFFGLMAATYHARHGAQGTAIGEPDAWEVSAVELLDQKKVLVRSLAQPSRDGRSPDTWIENIGALDPHLGAGPLNRALFLLAEGITNDEAARLQLDSSGQGMKGLGTDKTAAIWYRALTVYLKPTSGYKEARMAAIRAALDLFPPGPDQPADSPEAQAVRMAFAAIRVGTPQPEAGDPSLAPEVRIQGDQLTLGAQGAGLSAVTYLIDGIPAGAVRAEPWSLTLGTSRLLANGPHYWNAVLTGTDGAQRVVAGRTFRLANPVQQLVADPYFLGGAASPWLGGEPYQRKETDPPMAFAPFQGGGQSLERSLRQDLIIPAGTRDGVIKLRLWLTAPLRPCWTFFLHLAIPSLGYSENLRSLDPERDEWRDWVEYTIRLPRAALGQARDCPARLELRRHATDPAGPQSWCWVGEVRLVTSTEGPLAMVQAVPNRAKVNQGDTLQLKAELSGCEDRRVAWTLREREGATLGADGAFTPTLPGRYHAVATALGDPGASGEVCILVPEAAPAGPGSLETKGTTP